MSKFVRKDSSLGEKNKKKLDKFISNNSKEINTWMDDYIRLFNKCGKKTNEGSIQLGLMGAMVIAMFKSMGSIEKKEKIKLLKIIKTAVKKQ